MYYPYDKVNPFWLNVLKYWFSFADNDEIVSKNDLDRKRPTISPTKINTLLSPTKISPDFYNSLYKNANWMNDAKGNKVTHIFFLTHSINNTVKLCYNEQPGTVHFCSTVCARNCGLHSQKYWTTNFLLFLLSLFVPLKLGIYKKLRPEPFCRHAFVIPGVLSWFPATDLNSRSVFPACVFILHKGHDPWHTLDITGLICALKWPILLKNMC